jgi:PTH1 family peptidyl-tRNA hydrolase
LRARRSGSAGGHNGLKSLIEQLGTDEFARLRLGVGRGDERRNLAYHVLDTFDRDEQAVASEAIVRAADAAEVFVSNGLAPMMNKFNRREDKEEDKGEK